MAAAVVFVDADDRVLIVEPTYKDYWELPGGAVEADESPFLAACREIGEELGLSRRPGRLLVVDWVPPRPGRTDGLMLVFDGGVLAEAEVRGLALPSEELRSYMFCSAQEATARLSSLLARRLVAAIGARASGAVAYLEDGRPLDG